MVVVTKSLCSVYPGTLLSLSQSSIVVYDITSRSEVSRKQLEVSPAATLVRHLTVLDPSMLACSTARQLQLVPTGLKPKME